MRAATRLLCAVSLVLGGWAARPPAAGAAIQDTTADVVLGQPDFTHGQANENNVTASATSQSSPWGVAFDAQGDLFAADSLNNRVLEYRAPLTTGMSAALVIGQPDLTHSDINHGGLGAASLHGPTAVAIDAQGNLYVADSLNNRVLEYQAPLTTGMAASLVIGQPTAATNDINHGGLGSASLSAPYGVAVDSAGDIYVADSHNNRVLQYQGPFSNGMAASVVIGQPTSATGDFNHGGLSAASLSTPYNLAVDLEGNLYVVDSGNNRVLQYQGPFSNGMAASVVIGQPTSATNKINYGGLSATSLGIPYGVAVDIAGNLYVADLGNNRVLAYNAPLANGQAASLVFGHHDIFTSGLNNDGGLNADSLFYPEGLAVDPRNNLYVGDANNNRVLEYNSPLPRLAPAATSLSPAAVASGSPAFSLTVNGASFYGDSVVRWNGSARPTTFASSTQLTAAISAADLTVGQPFALTVFTPGPGGGGTTIINYFLYTRSGQDAAADAVQGQTSFTTMDGYNPLMPQAARLNRPGGAAVDRRTGRLFVADTFDSRVVSWPNAAAQANGQAPDLVLGQPNLFSTITSYGGINAVSLAFPEGVAVDGQGNLYVADPSANRVLAYAAPLATGQAASLVFGQGGDFTGSQANNGGISANSLYEPQGVAVDAQGNLYVADNFNNRVLEYNTPFSSGTTADRVFGQPDPTTGDSNHGGLSASSLDGPYGMALDAANNLYVADKFNNRVLEYNGPLTTGAVANRVFGQPTFLTNTANYNGVSALGLSDPQGLALDAQGNLFVTDLGNNRVLEFKSPLTADRSADRVFGQPDFTHDDLNHGGLSATSLYYPDGVALDADGHLFVADTSNFRVLVYDGVAGVAGVRVYLPLMRR